MARNIRLHVRYSSGRFYYYQESVVSEVDYTITYPKEYKDLCILAVGASNRMKVEDQWASLGAGALTFNKATALYSKKDKQVCHGMRVR